jgi:hypothetical protein
MTIRPTIPLMFRLSKAQRSEETLHVTRCGDAWNLSYLMLRESCARDLQSAVITSAWSGDAPEQPEHLLESSLRLFGCIVVTSISSHPPVASQPCPPDSNNLYHHHHYHHHQPRSDCHNWRSASGAARLTCYHHHAT